MKKRRIIPAFLVLCVIFAIVPRPGAAAAGMSGLEVIGQTTMTQQVFTDLSVIGADSCGLTDAINGAKNPAQTIGEWIKGYWDSWLLRQQLTWGTVLNIAAAGARYTGNGYLLFNSQLSDLFTRFYNWLWDGDSGPNIIQYANKGELNYATLNPDLLQDKSMLQYPNYVFNVNIYQTNPVQYVRPDDNNRFVFTGSGNVFVLKTRADRNTSSLVTFSDTPFAWSWVQYYADGSYRGGDSGNSSSYMYNNIRYYYYIFNGREDAGWNAIGMNPGYIQSPDGSYASASSVIWDVAYMYYNGAAIGDDQILGDPDKLGGLTGSERKRVAPPDIINFPDFGGNSGSIDVSDYLGGLRGAIESQDGTADVNITDSEGVQSTETMTIDQATDIPAETETTAEAVNQGELISTATPSTELADYTIDLRNYFPFCIPWDLYDMITLLVAEPVAPHVQYPFVIEPLNVNYTIDLDFSQFDSVAAVLRTMELLAAGIGLALMTKRLIQGGD